MSAREAIRVPDRAAAPRETFTLQLSTAATAAELSAWLASAAPGDRAVYAAGIDLPREAEGVQLVRRWAEQGLVHPFQQRDGARTKFSIEKARRADEPAAPAPGRVPPTGPGDAAVQAAPLLELLRDCAAAGAACPSNAELAKRIGLRGDRWRGKRGANRVQYLLAWLLCRRAISVQGRGTCAPRVVKILAAGRACGKSTEDRARGKETARGSAWPARW